MSQYKDQITGRVIYDLRMNGAYLLDYAKIDYSKTYTFNLKYSEYNVITKSSSTNRLFDQTSLYLKSGGLYYARNITEQNIDFTITMWVYIISGGNRYQQIILGKRLDGTLQSDIVNSYLMRPSYDMDNGKTSIAISNQNNIIGFENTSANIVLSTNTWHHMALTKQGSTVRYYIDGQLQITTNSPLTIIDTDLEISSTNEDTMCIGEATVILDQALWTGDSFEVPNNFLTGTKEFDSKYVIWNDKNTPIITGDVMTNIRTIGNKLIDISDYRVKEKIYWYNTNYSNPILTVSNNITKFSSTSFYESGSNCGFRKPILSSLNRSKFTLSFWVNPYYIDKSSGNPANFWGGICISSQSDKKQLMFVIDEINTGQPSLNCGHVCIRSDDPFRLYFSYKLRGNDTIPTNQWYHYALTYDGSNYKIYENGILLGQVTSNELIDIATNIWISAARQQMQFYYDDIVLISDQVLWTDNFTPPNDYLTGRNIPKRIHNSNILLPTNTEYNDYFDKVYLY